jgi:hypothetical protein
MVDTRAMFKPNLLLFWILALPLFLNVGEHGDMRGYFKLLLT